MIKFVSYYDDKMCYAYKKILWFWLPIARPNYVTNLVFRLEGQLEVMENDSIFNITKHTSAPKPEYVKPDVKIYKNKEDFINKNVEFLI